MKFTKRFCFSFLSLILSINVLCSNAVVFAENWTANTSCQTEAGIESEANERKILYQADGILLYQSKEDSKGDCTSTISATEEDNYGNVWLNKSSTGKFSVHNTHTGKIGVTWKVESSSDDSHAQIYMTTKSGLVVLLTKDVYPSDGDVHLEISNGASDYYVHYIATTSVGMRIMCWTYKN